MVRLVRSFVDYQSTCRLPVDIEVSFLFQWSCVLLRCGSLGHLPLLIPLWVIAQVAVHWIGGAAGICGGCQL